MLSHLLCRLLTLTLGTAYPAYASFKAVKNKNPREYIKWMMYWIVFSLYTIVEVITDIFLGFWFPLYYELKFFLVMWLIFPGSKVPRFIYINFIHPHLSTREEQIDAHIERIWEHFYAAFRQIGSQGANYLLDATVQLVQKSQVTVATQVPRILGLPQGDSVLENFVPSSTEAVHEVDRNSGDYEDFDVLSMDNEIDMHEDSDISALVQEHNLPLPHQDSSSNLEDETSEGSHHSRLSNHPVQSRKRDISSETGSTKGRKLRQRKSAKK